MADFLQQGITALEVGDKKRARQLLLQAIQINPDNEQAWLWLAGAAETDDERITCLNEVLSIDPGNKYAKRGMAVIRKKNSNFSRQRESELYTGDKPSEKKQGYSTITSPQPRQFTSNVSQSHHPTPQRTLENFAPLIAHEIDQGKTRSLVVQEMVDRGFEREAVKKMVDEIARSLKPVYSKQHLTRLFRGIGLAIFGIVLSYLSSRVMTSIDGDGRFVLFYGMILVGLLDAFLGIIGWFTNFFR